MGKQVVKEYLDLLKVNKKFILLYVLFISILTASMITQNNLNYPKTEIITFILSIFLGTFFILYGFKNKDNLPKVAFLIIFVFGLIILVFTPSFVIPDEYIHLNKVLDILNGNLLNGNWLPSPNTKSTAMINKFYNSFYWEIRSKAPYDSGINSIILNCTQAYIPISQNPKYIVNDLTTSTLFYPYIFSAIGVYISQILDVGVIFVIWLSRLPNLIVYSIASYYAIKKVKVYRMALFVVACNPLILSLITSCNYDSFNFICLIVAMSYFIYMLENKFKIRKLFIFIGLCILMIYTKINYVILLSLIFFIPLKNFEFKYINFNKIKEKYGKLFITLLLVIIVALIVLTMKGIIPIGARPRNQLDYLISHPSHILDLFKGSILFLNKIIINTPGYREYVVGAFKGAKIYNILYLIFFLAFSILYPIKIKLSRNKRIILGLIIIAFYFGIYFLIYLLWHKTGSSLVTGMQARYFIFLLPLIPIILNYPFKKIENINAYTIVGIVTFMMGLLMFIVTHFY